MLVRYNTGRLEIIVPFFFLESGLYIIGDTSRSIYLILVRWTQFSWTRNYRVNHRVQGRTGMKEKRRTRELEEWSMAVDYIMVPEAQNRYILLSCEERLF